MQLIHYSLLSSSIFLFFLLLLQSITTIQSITSPNPKTLDDFIKKSCQVTRYSDLCYSSLSSFYTGHPNIGMLTNAAIGISLTKAVHTSDYLAAVSQSYKTKNPARASMAVQDCMELTKDAVEQVRKSMDQTLRVLTRFQMSNVQTWLSAAITDLTTCIHGLNEVDQGGKDDEVSGKVRMVLKFITNALALVHTSVDSN